LLPTGGGSPGFPVLPGMRRKEVRLQALRLQPWPCSEQGGLRWADGAVQAQAPAPGMPCDSKETVSRVSATVRNTVPGVTYVSFVVFGGRVCRAFAQTGKGKVKKA